MLIPWIAGGIALLSLIIWGCIFWRHRHTGDDDDKVFFVGVGIFLSMAAGALSLGFLMVGSEVISCNADYVWAQDTSQEMVSMRSNDGTSGQFSGFLFMSAGFVEQRETYFYYLKTPDGGFQPAHVEADSNTIIYEQDRKDGKVIFYHAAFRNPNLKWIAFERTLYRTEFYVPKGSIQKQFTVQ